MFEKYLHVNFLGSVMCQTVSVGDFAPFCSVCHRYRRHLCACIWL